MESNRSAQSGAPPPVDDCDWRRYLLPESRQRIVNKIWETSKRLIPFSGEEGLQELRQFSIRVEDEVYNSATSQPDYLRTISLKMLAMEAKSLSSLPNALPSNSSGTSNNPQDSDLVSGVMSLSLDSSSSNATANDGSSIPRS